jgi:hypothetical protein
VKWQYDTFVEAMQDPKHPDHEMYAEWFGEEGFDPEAFDLDAVNVELRRLR